MSELTECQKEFEHWASNEGEWKKAVEKGPNDSYKLMTTSLQWDAWKASWNTRHGPQVDLDMLAEETANDWYTIHPSFR